MEKRTFIAALLSYIKPIGYVILPYSCFRESEKYITVHERLSALNISQYPDLNEAEKEFFAIVDSFSNQAIIKQFSKKGESPKDFFENINKKLLDAHIRPFIERRLAKIIEILVRNSIPFYNGKNGYNLYTDDKIEIEEECLTTSLSFIRTSDGTLYKLRAFHTDKEIKLNDPENVILVNDPCWYITTNRMFHFNEQINGKLLIPFRNKEFVSIPKHIENQYYSTFIRKIANRCEIDAEGFLINDFHYEPSAVLSLEADWQGYKSLVLYFQYGDKLILANNPQKSFTSLLTDENGFVFNRFKRNLAWESEQVQFLKSKNLRQVEATFILNEQRVASHSDYHFIEWLVAQISDLKEHSFTIRQPENIRYVFEAPILDLKLDSGFDWFDLNGIVTINDLCIPFIKFKDHIINNIKEYLLPSGEYIILPDEWFSRFQDIMLCASGQNEVLRLGKHHYKLLSTIDSLMVQQISEAIEYPEQVKVPELSDVTLRPYQQAGFYWMYSLQKHGFGGILADDMGLGKTVQTITLLASYYPYRESKADPDQTNMAQCELSHSIQLDLFDQPETIQKSPVHKPNTKRSSQPPCSLIVLPASLIHNWFNELERFAPWLKVYIHAGSNRATYSRYFDQFDIILTTYGILRNDVTMLSNYKFGYAILDESQYIKNPDSKATQAVFSLQCLHRMALTGTPIQNSLSDIWSQFNFINPGMLGSQKYFAKQYAIPIAKNLNDFAAKKLNNLISPFILRRTKEEVAPELPPITESVVLCSMTDEQQHIYETEKSKVRNSIIGQFKEVGIKNSAILVLRSLTLLRQLANHPRMLDTGSNTSSGKFTEITESLRIVLEENHRILVFSSFVRHLKLLEEFCIESSFSYAMLTGATINREKVINAFKQKDDIRVFLISLKAGGVGLNLTEADYVFILDPWWNPAAEMQALNRAHRIGQDKNVFVYRFITKDTVEEKIVQMQKKKKFLAELFMPSDMSIAGMTEEEILNIFS